MSEEEQSAPTPPPAPKGGSKMIPVMLVMNTALMGGVMMFVMKRPAPAPAPAAATPAAPAGEGAAAAAPKPAGPAGDQPGPILKLENFVIQLRGSETERYVRVAFDLEVNNEMDKDLVAAHLSPIRDAVIAYFSDLTLDDLKGSDGMERCKKALLGRIDAIVPGRHIKALYITDFIVQ